MQMVKEKSQAIESKEEELCRKNQQIRAMEKESTKVVQEMMLRIRELTQENLYQKVEIEKLKKQTLVSCMNVYTKEVLWLHSFCCAARNTAELTHSIKALLHSNCTDIHTASPCYMDLTQISFP